jgi:hypothetical protein
MTPLQANGRTALHFAAGWGEAVITELLLRKRCNPDLIDKAGMSRSSSPPSSTIFSAPSTRFIFCIKTSYNEHLSRLMPQQLAHGCPSRPR